MSARNETGQTAKSAPNTGTATPPVSVLVVDDHHVVRVGLCMVLRDHPQLRVVGEASTAAEAIAKYEKLRPEVVLLDIRMPDGSGIEVCRWIKQQHIGTRVLFLTSYSDQDTLVEALGAGADGYVLKTVNGADIADAVEKVGRGEAIVDPLVARQMFSLVALGSSAGRLVNSSLGLTDLDHRVLAMVHAGRSNKEIGAALGLSEKNVRNLLSMVFRKFSVTSRKEAGDRWAASRNGTFNSGKAD